MLKWFTVLTNSHYSSIRYSQNSPTMSHFYFLEVLTLAQYYLAYKISSMSSFIFNAQTDRLSNSFCRRIFVSSHSDWSHKSCISNLPYNLHWRINGYSDRKYEFTKVEILLSLIKPFFYNSLFITQASVKVDISKRPKLVHLMFWSSAVWNSIIAQR